MSDRPFILICAMSAGCIASPRDHIFLIGVLITIVIAIVITREAVRR